MWYTKKILVVEECDDQWKLIQAAIESIMPGTEAVWVSDSNQSL
jgi:hypothetical protein